MIYLFIAVCSALLVLGLLYCDRSRAKKNEAFFQYLKENGLSQVDESEIKILLSEISRFSQDYYLPGDLINCLKNNENQYYVLRTFCSYVTGHEASITMIAIQLDFDNKLCGHFKLSQIKKSRNELNLFIRDFLYINEIYQGKIVDICFCEKFLVNILHDRISQFDLEQNVDILLSLKKELRERN